VDITASVISNWLLWRHRLGPGLAVRYLSPPIGSALVLRYADLDTLARSAAGRYVLEHIPPRGSSPSGR
jgi:hypothetical protein